MSETLITAGQYSVVVPLATGLYYFRQLPSTGRWAVALLFAWLIAETAFYLTRINGIHNGWISYWLSLAEFFILWRFYSSLLPDLPVRWLALVGAVVTIVEYFVGNIFNSVSLIYESGLIVALGILLFRDMMEGRVDWGYGWFTAGLMILFIGSSVYYSSYLHPDDIAILRMLRDLHTMLLFFVYFILTIGMWRLPRVKK